MIASTTNAMLQAPPIHGVKCRFNTIISMLIDIYYLRHIFLYTLSGQSQGFSINTLTGNTSQVVFTDNPVGTSASDYQPREAALQQIYGADRVEVRRNGGSPNHLTVCELQVFAGKFRICTSGVHV